MAKTSIVSARIEPGLKENVGKIFRTLGLTATQAITLFYKQVELRNGLPFDVAIPNKTTCRTFRDTDTGKNIVVCEDSKDMFRKLGI